MASELSALVDDAIAGAREALDDVKAYLASPEGRALRHKVATALIAAAPLLGSVPVVRRSPLGRVIGSAAVAGIAIRAAQYLRDWEPAPPRGATAGGR